MHNGPRPSCTSVRINPRGRRVARHTVKAKTKHAFEKQQLQLLVRLHVRQKARSRNRRTFFSKLS